jgi:hypothetical protein
MRKPQIAIVTDDAKTTPPADYEAECLQGRELAAALIAEMVESGKTYLLGWKMKKMALVEPWTGVQVGFCAYFSEKAIEGAAA